MFYIHRACCISPQHTFDNIDLDTLVEPQDNKLMIIEPGYERVSPKALRRMNKGTRIGAGAARALGDMKELSGIIIGTANGGMEDSVHFLNQIMEYDEGLLLPGSFVQSTANATAATLSLMSGNKGYNITHVHRGTAFENAVTDAAMMLREHGQGCYLLGAVDEIAGYHYKFEWLEGWYKQEPVSGGALYGTGTAGTIAGEGAAMFIVGNLPDGAIARLAGVATIHTRDADSVADRMLDFLERHGVAAGTVDLLLTGEDGDSRFQHFYSEAEELVGEDTTVARFKHMCGSYPTASAFGVWLGCQALGGLKLPEHMVKRQGSGNRYRNILIYNHTRGLQHTFMLLSAPGAIP